MNLRQRRHRHTAVETGALSDILFFLMLFFLIVSTLASPNAIKLLLPKASTGQTVPRQVIELSVNADLEVFIGSTPSSSARLEDDLRAAAAGKENPTVVLRMDKSVKVEELVRIVDVVNKTKLPLVIATDKAKS